MLIVIILETIDSIARYALLHNTMGGYNGDETWCYVEGGMGSVSMAIAKAAQLHGAELHTEKVNRSLGGGGGVWISSPVLNFLLHSSPLPPPPLLSLHFILHSLNFFLHSPPPPPSSSSPHVPCSLYNRSL